MTRTSTTPTLAGGSVAPAQLARPTGTFAMVAADQRDSLRTMMAERAGVPGEDIPHAHLTDFKMAVARELAPHASALLIDRDYGYRRLIDDQVLPGSCAPILAVDVLDQQPGQAVEGTSLDEAVDTAAVVAHGTRGLKLLVIWRRDDQREQRVELASRFIDLCRSAGLASVLEPVARPAHGEEGTFVLNDAIVEAAIELAPLRPSLYKCQVPDGGVGSLAHLTEQSARIDAVVDVPWVVLSQGVTAADFPAAVEAACRAGASGFLAGRALWTDALTGDRDAALRGPSTDRLRRLGDIVDTHGRPWWDTTAARDGEAASREAATREEASA
ncbi:hypothetical protein [Streptomyces endophyticus]|uniref:Aldolase n=1 Tax=Streptomyces endophyticus TaxID=714166 RepID=A0ABU6FCY3_9ACTN|nr:hypothetical protein [Streptomyces endophyticus]MEB8341492.1 hypothetical protein [Streptomyces endophyticus]